MVDWSFVTGTYKMTGEGFNHGAAKQHWGEDYTQTEHLRLRASLLLFLKGFEAEKPELPQHQSFPAIPHGVGQVNGAFLLGCLDCL